MLIYPFRRIWILNFKLKILKNSYFRRDCIITKRKEEYVKSKGIPNPIPSIMNIILKFWEWFSHSLFRANILHFFAEQDKAKFRKNENFRTFLRANELRTNAKLLAKNFIFAKNSKFSRKDFPFRWKPFY